MRSVLALILLPLLVASIPNPRADRNSHKNPSTQNSLNVGAFNIQVFGLSKMEDQVAVDNIIQILLKYDICLIQEIRDSSETAIYDLLNQLNAASAVTYDIVISARLGRTSSKEQYAFFYDRSKFSVADVYTYHDNQDRFEREPYIVTFNVIGYSISQFAFLAIHAKPEDAVAELDLLVQVYDESIGNGAVPTSNWLFGGDFNADCSYVGPADWENIRLWTDNRFTWIIGNGVDTTVSATDCAYDRLVLSGNLNSFYVSGTADAYNYWSDLGLSEQEALDVSDHYPVEMVFD